MTVAERVEAYNGSTFGQRWPASRLWVVQEQGRDVMYGVWVIGAFFRNLTPFHGAYPRSYLDRVGALFADARDVLHACSGSLPPGPYTRLDLHPDRGADVVGDVCHAPELLGDRRFDLEYVDPPYSADDARIYGTPPFNRQRAIEALAFVTRSGGHAVWLDDRWPVHNRRQWGTIGRIFIVRSTNHRFRGITIFQREAW